MTPDVFFENFAHLADAPSGVQKLRELILQMAVRGKLVPQDKNEEPASILLANIKAEKERLVKEKKIRKSDPLPPVADDETPFELPQGWTWVRLDDVCSYIQRGKGPDYVEKSDYPVISQKCIQWNGLQIDRARFISPSSIEKYSEERFLSNGDLLWNSTGTGTIGRMSLYQQTNNTFKVVVADSHVTVLRPLLICSKYLLFWIASPIVQNEIEGISSGSTNQIELSTSTVKSHIAPLPPLAEQHRIVTKIDQLMYLCDELEAKQKKKHLKLSRLNNSALNQLTSTREKDDFTAAWHLVRDNFDLLYTTPETIAKLRQAVLQLAVQGRLLPQDKNDEPASVLLAKIKAEKERLVKEKKIRKSDPLPPIKADEVPYELPKGWEWARFVDVANIASNLVKPEAYLKHPHVAPDNIEKQTGKLLPCRTVQEDGVTSSKHLFCSGQIIYSKIRPNLSKATIVDFGGLCSADMYPIDPFISTRYLLHYMLSSTFLGMAVKNDTRVAMPKINQEELNRILVPVCPLVEQHRIVTKVDQLMALCDELETKLTKSQVKADKLAGVAAKDF